MKMPENLLASFRREIALDIRNQVDKNTQQYCNLDYII